MHMNQPSHADEVATLTAALRDIQNRLAALADQHDGGIGPTDHTIGPELLPTRAARLYRARRRRDALFGDDAALFGEAAWDILLDLYAAQRASRPVCVSSAGIASVAPTTTGLRYVAALERRGLIVRTADRLDRRRNWLHLSDRAVGLMEAYLAHPEV